MERSTQIIVGLVVLAGLGGLVYYKAKEDQKIGTSSTTAADLPEIKAPEDVDKIAITNTDKGTVTVEKKGDKWEVTEPVKAPANQANIKSVIDNLKDLKAKDVIYASPADDVKKDSGFEPGKSVHVVAMKGGEKKLDVSFGKSGTRGQLAMVDGKPGIYAVTGYSSYLYTREPKYWRDMEILKFDDANATSMTIERKDGTLSFTKGDKWAGTWKDKPIDRFDEDKVKDALRAFKALNAEDFADGKTPADTGLDAPEAKVVIRLKDNAGEYKLAVGKTSTGTSRYVQREGNDTIFVIPGYTAEWAAAEQSKFQKPVDAGAPKDGGAPTAMPPMPGMPGMPPMPHPDPHGH